MNHISLGLADWLKRRTALFGTCLVSIIATGIIILSVAKIVRQSSAAWPLDPWEAAVTTVAARVAQGEPMYSRLDQPGSIEPGLYSPLQPLVLAGIFRVWEPSFLPARAINLAAGVIFITFIVVSLRLHRNPGTAAFSVAVLLVLDRQLTGLWDFPRGDAVALLLCLAYLACAYRACRKNSLPFAVLAHGALLAGLFWKQTALAVAPAAFLGALVTPGCAPRMRKIFFFCPPLAVAAAVLAVKTLSPNLFEMMFALGGKYAISPRYFALFAYAGLLFTPLFWMVFGWALSQRALAVPTSLKLRWSLVVALSAFPLDLLAAAKVGGGANSLAHVYYALGIACLCYTNPLFAFIQTPAIQPLKRLAFAACLAAAMAVQWTSVLHPPSRVKNNRPFGDSGREVVIRFARDLPGKVISPQDPTIAFEAKGYSGVALANEWDHHLWKWPLPKVSREISEADYVITWGEPNTWQTWMFDSGLELLSELGYSPVKIPGLGQSRYQIWHRH